MFFNGNVKTADAMILFSVKCFQNIPLLFISVFVNDFVAILSFNFSKFHFKGDAMLVHDGMMFSTYDNDNDGKIENCALNYHGGWWYHLCHEANLNGKYYPAPGKPISFATGVNWKQFRGFQESLKTSVMALSLK